MQLPVSSLWTLALAVAALAPAAAAQQAEPAQSARDERVAERNRVLELGSGAHVRAMTRWVTDAEQPDGGRWEMREKGGWRELRAGEVVAWRDERELLREAARLSKELGAKDSGRRVALAEWLVTHGLDAEALAELDRVLRDEPDYDAALALLSRGAFERPEAGNPYLDPVGVRERLIAQGTTQSPARRELVILALRDLEDVEGTREALLRELVAYRHRQRAFAAHAMRRLIPGEELRPLLSRAALDNSSEVRLVAALALRASGQEGVIVPLVRALSSPNAVVRTNAVEALGNVGFQAAVPVLVNHLANLAQSGGNLRPSGGYLSVTKQVAIVQDFDVEIAQAASIADPKIDVAVEGVILEGRAYGMQEHRLVTEFQTVRTSLELLTGEDAGKRADDWTRWYEANRARYERPAPPTGK